MSIFDSTDDFESSENIADQISDSDRTSINIATFAIWANIGISFMASLFIYKKLIVDADSPIYWIVIFSLLLQCILSWALFKMFSAITINVIIFRTQFSEYLDRTKLKVLE
jgi:hypothetical protein